VRRGFKTWLPLAVVLTLAVASAYGVGQQVLRQSANDPQIQLAEDWTTQIETGSAVTGLNLGNFIDPAKSLAPFGIVYNKDGSVANSSVAAPSTMTPPTGVFNSVDTAPNNQLRFSWRPSDDGSRYAAVIQRANIEDKTYYVLAGRNLREVEARTDKLLLLVIAGWLIGQVALVASLNLHHAHRVIRKVTNRR
jgi:hypothetical protein